MAKDYSHRIGSKNFNRYNSEFEVIKYNSANSVIIKFDNGFTKEVKWNNFKTGKVQSPYCKTILGVGYIGEGIYKPTNGRKAVEQYETWRSMLNRCYSEKFALTQEVYSGCSVCEEWHSFQVFAKWYDENYYQLDDFKSQLDKDILVKGNKVYSPETCVFVSRDINVLFTSRKNYRGAFPIGTKLHKRTGKYESGCNNRGRDIYLGLYESPEEAFIVYKDYKEKLIKEIANEDKDNIPKKLYHALMDYKVSIND